MKKHLLLIISLITILSFTSVVYADNKSLEKATESDCNLTINSICRAIISNNKDTLLENSDYFENSTYKSSAYKSVYDFMSNNDIDGTCSNIVIDTTYPNNSSTGDFVIMANCKVNVKQGYNLVYLFEFHVNKDGRIYGFNAWVY